MLCVQLPIESQFIKTAADSLNAEVVLGTVQVRRGGGRVTFYPGAVRLKELPAGGADVLIHPPLHPPSSSLRGSAYAH